MNIKKRILNFPLGQKRIMILILVVVFIVACEKVPSESDVIMGTECTTNDDCVTGGCSGTICQSKDAEPIFTTCEFLPEYACYREIDCGCINGNCQWDETVGFDRCVEGARESGGDVIV